MEIAKAQPVGDKEPFACSIHFSFTCPDFKDLNKAMRFFTEQARDLENNLWGTLPGGTYDALLGLMLKRKSSHFIVPHMDMG